MSAQRREWRGSSALATEIVMVATRFAGEWDEWALVLNGVRMRSIYDGATIAETAREITECHYGPLATWAEVAP